MKGKKALCAVAAAVAFAMACGAGVYAYEKAQINKYKNEKSVLPEGFTVTAHTGCLKTKENSLESIETGASNADIVEFDLNFDSDGNAVLSHDAPKGDEVTLDMAFETLSKLENTRVNIDIKSTANLAVIEQLAKKNNMQERIFLTGVDDEFVKAVKNSCSGTQYYLNVDVDKKKNENEEYLLSLVAKVKESGAVGINFNKNSASKKLVEVFHENGLLVSIWTVDEEKDIYKILSFAPDNITSRNPDKVKEIAAVK